MRRLLLLAAPIAVFLVVLMAGTGLAAATSLLGNPSVGSLQDNDPAGLAEAFQFRASASGDAQSISIYVDSGSRARGLAVGVYDDNSGHPGSLLASGSTSALVAGAWNDVTLNSTPTLSSGTSYWLAVLGTGGQLNFRDVNLGTGSCSENSSRSDLTSLPSAWTSGTTFTTCSLSAYVNGAATPTTTSAPANTVLPMISGTAQQGQTLVATSGTWANNVASYLYAWEDCDTSGDNCVNIGGATASGYTLQASDVGATLRSVVTASNSGGSVSARSAATAVVVAEPPAAFSFAPASPTTGQNVHFDASSSTCQDTPCTYTWSDNPPSGGSWALGTGPTLDFVFRVTGTKYVTLTVTDASNNSATVEHDVVVTAAQTVSAPSNTALPVISGTATQGQTLTTSNGSWNGSPTAYAYQWRQCDASGNNCTNITGGTSSSYTLAAGDVGQTVRVVVTATNAGGSTPATSAQTSAVAGQAPAAPSNTALPVISGTATQGETLSTSNGSWNGSPTAYAYQWRQCDGSGNNCTNITGGTSSSYTLAAGDVGQTVRVVVTATNAGGSTPATSAQTSAVASSGGGTSCSLNATTSNFASQVLAASAGQTICLASGNYGTWNGTSKAITVTAASGASPQMQVNFGSSANGFTLNGMTGMGGSISAGATNVIIENSTFTSTIDIEGATHDVVLDHNTHNWMVGPSTGGPNAKLFVDVSGTLAAPALTVENSDIENGDLDGVHVGGGSGLVVLNNTFKNLCDMGANHTDNIQFEGGTQIRIAGNYLYEAQNCPTQGITSYDGGTNGLIVEDNVVDVPRDWGIELYSDQNSIVRHNTVVYHPKSYSEFNTGTGDIDIDRKSQDPAGTGTHVYDNVASVSFANGSSGSADHNTDPSTVSYVGGAPGPSSVFSDLFLTGTSPGHNAASDGFDTGIRDSIS